MFKKLLVEVVDVPQQFRLIAPLYYDTARDHFSVPRDFVTDFASIPAVCRPFFSVNGAHRKAAVLHDYLYSFGSPCHSRKDADLLFLDAMRVVGVGRAKRAAMYRAVRIFGGSRWDKKS